MRRGAAADAVIAASLSAGVASRTVAIDAVPPDMLILDIGEASVADLIARLAGMKTLVWNGPLGAFETPPFDKATTTFAHAVAEATSAA